LDRRWNFDEERDRAPRLANRSELIYSRLSASLQVSATPKGFDEALHGQIRYRRSIPSQASFLKNYWEFSSEVWIRAAKNNPLCMGEGL
jgi:hypothetical protein